MSVMAYASRALTAAAGSCSASDLAGKVPATILRLAVVVALLLASGLRTCVGAENNLPPPPGSLAETNSQELLRLSLQLQEQLRAAQLAIEQNRQEAKAAVAQSGEALSQGLRVIEQAVSAQRARDLEAMRRSNQIMLIVVGAFAAVGFLAMLIMTYFQWRMSEELAVISAALPAMLGISSGSAAAALAPAHPSNPRLLGAAEQPKPRANSLDQEFQARPGPKPSIDQRLFSPPGEPVPRRQFRALGLALVVGLLCAAVLALLFYMVTFRKLGFGHIHRLLLSFF